MNKKRRAVRSNLENKIYKPWAKRSARGHIQWLVSHQIVLSPSATRIYQAYLEWHYLQATQNDSLLFLLKQQSPNLSLPTQLANRLDAYKVVHADKLSSLKDQANSVGAGSKMLQAKASLDKYGKDLSKYHELPDGEAAKTKALSQGKSLAESKMGNTGEVAALKNQLGQSKSLLQHGEQVKQLQDSAYLKEQARKKAQEIAMQYMADNPGVVQSVQNKMDLLMKKYSIVPNSNDLSTAIKRTSLKGKPLRQRLYLAGNFQAVSFKPMVVDFAPMGGYRLNANLVLGLGGNYRQAFGDSTRHISPDVLGYKGFVQYNLFAHFILSAELSRNSPGTYVLEGKSKRLWENALLAGVGRKLMISARLETTIVVLCNFLHQPNDAVYANPWCVRVGLQGSPLAFLKK